MSCLGVHFALSDEDVVSLFATASDVERLEYLQEGFEHRYFQDPASYMAQSDKAWDAMHRLLAGGPLACEGGSYPLSHVVMGGKPIYFQDDDIMSLKTPAQVADIASALRTLSEDQFRSRYRAIDAADYGFDLTDEDLAYTWEWFQEVRSLFERAASEDRHVLFTADQ